VIRFLSFSADRIEKIKDAEVNFGLRFFSRPEPGRDKKDAEASKSVTSPYKRTAEAKSGAEKADNLFFGEIR